MVSRGKTKPPPPLEFDLKGWQEALEMVAKLVAINPVYVPIFVRIEAEIARLTTQQDAVARARAIVARRAQD